MAHQRMSSIADGIIDLGGGKSPRSSETLQHLSISRKPNQLMLVSDRNIAVTPNGLELSPCSVLKVGAYSACSCDMLSRLSREQD